MFCVFFLMHSFFVDTRGGLLVQPHFCCCASGVVVVVVDAVVVFAPHIVVTYLSNASYHFCQALEDKHCALHAQPTLLDGSRVVHSTVKASIGLSPPSCLLPSRSSGMEYTKPALLSLFTRSVVALSSPCSLSPSRRLSLLFICCHGICHRLGIPSEMHRCLRI